MSNKKQILITPWLLILQVVLLVAFYGFRITMPWWVLFLPLIIWIGALFFIGIVIFAAIIFAVGVSLWDSGHPIVATVGTAVAFGVLAGFLSLAGSAILGFLSGVV